MDLLGKHLNALARGEEIHLPRRSMSRHAGDSKSMSPSGVRGAVRGFTVRK